MRRISLVLTVLQTMQGIGVNRAIKVLRVMQWFPIGKTGGSEKTVADPSLRSQLKA